MSVLPSKSWRYFIAIAATAVAFTARLLLGSTLGDVAPLLIFTLSVMVSAWYGGLGPGLLATALGLILGDYFFIAESFAERIEEVLFLGIGISISILSQARISLEEKRQQLLTSEREARRAAEDANQLKDEFLSTVSHELRTPLNAINGWAQMLCSGRLDTAQSAHALEIIVRSARSQNQLINDLLDVSRIITGRMRLDICSLDLGSVIEAAVDTVRLTAVSKGINLNVQLDPKVAKVSGDGERLKQVVWNLLSNAIKFAPKGGYVKVRFMQVNQQVEISVSDNGQGIKPDFLPYVFDHFRQEEGGLSRRHGGLGLGLSIVRHIVELHGGSVSASSDGLNKGATFTVMLPIASQTALPPDIFIGKADGKQNTPILAGLRVLFVDDEADARDLIAMMLTEGGAVVRTAASAIDALAACDEWRPDILISDIGMPGEDGYMLMKKLRASENEWGGHIPAIALTAYGRKEDRMRALAVGYESHVAKPVEPVALLTIVANLANRT